MKTFSQVGQDFWVISEGFHGKRGGYFLDVGAHDGITLSNTFLLERDFGWKGLLIEADPEVFTKLIKNRPRLPCLNVCLDAGVGEITFIHAGDHSRIHRGRPGIPPNWRGEKLPTRPLVDVLEEQKAPREIDYLSIDIEGAEERVLGDFPFDKYLFKCLTIERPTMELRSILSKDYIKVREVPRLDVFYVHVSHLKYYEQNIYTFWKEQQE